MGLLNDAINFMDSTLFDSDFAESIIYTPVGGSPVTIPARFQEGVTDNNNGIQGDGVSWQLTIERDFRADFRQGGTRHIATVIISASEIASPEYRDTISINGTDWIVTEIFDNA